MAKDLTYFPVHPKTFPRKWRPLGMSLVTHTLLALFLILWCFSPVEENSPDEIRQASIVLSVNNDESQPDYLTEAETVKQLRDQVEQDHSAAISIDAPPPIKIEPTDVPDRTGSIPVESLIFDASGMSNVPQQPRSNIEFQLSQKDLDLIEADRKLINSRQPVGDATSISVFGSGNLIGRDFVFVIDRSQSMGSGGLGVIQASRRELSDAINQLESNHSFQIVGYHDTTVTMSSRKMLAANAKNKAAVADFLGGIAAYGGTNHEAGLVTGIAFHPDVIVFMTDGGYPELNEGKLKMIKRWAGNKTQIHCLQFGAGSRQQKINFMTRLAEQNNGSYRYIDVNQWNKSR